MFAVGLIIGCIIPVVLVVITNRMLRKKGKQFGLVDYKKWKNEK